jgi:hypothetical protein
MNDNEKEVRRQFMNNVNKIRKEPIKAERTILNDKDVAKSRKWEYKDDEEDDGEEYQGWSEKKE